MKFTYILLVLLAAVAVGGTIYVLRPSIEPRLDSRRIEPTPTPIDNTEKFPPPTPTPVSIQPINQTVNITLETSMGNIDVALDGAAAPYTVGNFVQLAQKDFYDGTTFHRVIPDFMIQGGDPFSIDPRLRARHGTGGPGYQFQDEVNDRKIVRGAIAMANSGPNTNGSQFFIVTGEAFPHLDGKHTNFGEVTNGMDVVDAISQVEADERDNPQARVVISDVLVHDAPSNENPLKPL